jgi:uncharacterized protein YjbI with pentapeptide repeats
VASSCTRHLRLRLRRVYAIQSLQPATKQSTLGVNHGRIANLKRAIWKRANLKRANHKRANCKLANRKGANLKRANERL